MRFLAIILLLLIFNEMVAQEVKSDLLLLQKQRVSIKGLQAPQKNKSFNPLSLLYSGTMGFYQAQISPQWGANCAFEITCSRFSKQLVQGYGLAKGFFLTMDRLGRCNKLSFYETVPIRINPQGKLIDSVDFYSLR